MSTAPPPAPDWPPPPPHELYCTECGYNLSGTIEDRCPECGQAFDRRALIHWTYSDRQPLPFGNLESPVERSSLVAVTLFSPGQLGRLLPPHADADAAKHHATVMHGWAGLGVPLFFIFLVSIVLGESGVLLVVLLVPLPMMLAATACEHLTATLIFRWVPPLVVPTKDYRQFWLTLVRCFSTHLLAGSTLLCLAIGLVALLQQASRKFAGASVSGTELFTLPPLALLGALLWWWYGLARAILARSAASPARTVVIALIPVVGVAGFALGFGIMALESLILFSLCRF